MLPVETFSHGDIENRCSIACGKDLEGKLELEFALFGGDLDFTGGIPPELAVDPGPFALFLQVPRETQSLFFSLEFSGKSPETRVVVT